MMHSGWTPTIQGLEAHAPDTVACMPWVPVYEGTPHPGTLSCTHRGHREHTPARVSTSVYRTRKNPQACVELYHLGVLESPIHLVNGGPGPG